MGSTAPEVPHRIQEVYTSKTGRRCWWDPPGAGGMNAGPHGLSAQKAKGATGGCSQKNTPQTDSGRETHAP
eukprot:6899383-Alexandrium_andersonii.AAC.1